jgi:CelD/BcsL family acetyltransferase involved in cellulose biosynthesis
MATDPAAKKASFLTATTADYCDVISDPNRRNEILQAVLRELQRQGMSWVVLANVPADSPTVPALRSAARECRYRTFERPGYLCSRIVLGEGDRRNLLRETIANRKRLRYYLRRMQALGPVRIDHLTRWDSIQPALAPFFQAHMARFAASNRTSNLAQPERQCFLQQLAELLCAKGWLVLSRLSAGDEVLAWNYGFQFSGSWFWYQPTFATNSAHLSPGFCLLSKTVEAACDRADIDLVDLGLGAEEYKDRFATDHRRTLHVTATSSNAVYAREIAKYHVASKIKRYPRLDRWLRVQLGGSVPHEK